MNRLVVLLVLTSIAVAACKKDSSRDRVTKPKPKPTITGDASGAGGAGTGGGGGAGAAGAGGDTGAGGADDRQTGDDSQAVSFDPNGDGGLGFYPLSAPGVPPAIATAGESVFVLKVLAASNEELVYSYDVSEAKGAALKEKIMAFKESALDAMAKIVVIKQIERCEADEDPDVRKSCVFTLEIHQGTGFLFGDGSTLWTNAHAIEGNLKATEKYKEMPIAEQLRSQHPLRVFVFDKSGNLVVNPFTDKVVPAILPVESAAAKMDAAFYAEDSDYIGLKLSKPIGAPLALAAEPAAVGTKIFTVGFPACTGCSAAAFEGVDPLDFADRSPYPNSNGKGLKITSGVMLAADGLTDFFGVNEATMGLYNLERMVFHSADSQHGNSGGPILNANGEVVAIHTGGKSKMVNGKLERVSRAVIPPQFSGN